MRFFDSLLRSNSYQVHVSALDEKYGFRDLKFGDPLGDDFEEIGPMGDAGMVLYRRPSDSLRIGEADLQSINYTFYRGRFCVVTFSINDAHEFSRLGEVFFKAYGRPLHDDSELSEESYTWSAAKTHLFLHWDHIEREGFALMKSKPIEEEAKRDRELDAERGVSDL